MHKRMFMTRALGGVFAFALACTAALPAFAADAPADSGSADAAAVASDGADAQAGWSDEAKELAANDTRMGNSIGYNGGVDYWGEYQNYIDNVKYADRDAENAETEAPKRYVDYFGNIYQPVPSDPSGWNNTYLNADNRGCMSCHKSMDDIMINMDTRHDVYVEGYPATVTIANCIGCHNPNPMPGKNPMYVTMHGLHNGNPAFQAMGGTCESCHFITSDGEFEMWDLAKYDQFKGTIDVAAEDANLDITYDQDTISENDEQFFKSLWEEPSSWRSDSDESVADDWIVSIGGDVENPIEASVSELKEMFGTETYTMVQQCIENGTGNPWIFQAEFTGIPMKDIIDYVKPADNVNKFKYSSEDGYSLMPISLADVEQDECLLVTEINGETLPATQGWPLTLAVPRGSAASYVKALQGFDFIYDEETAQEAAEASDEEAEEEPGTPNAGVLNYPDGKVFENGETVHLEGFADAFGDPISKVEYSLDGGDTWTELDTPDNDPMKWTYWRLDFNPPQPGSYLLKIRAYCQGESGTEYEPVRDTNFLFTVDE